MSITDSILRPDEIMRPRIVSLKDLQDKLLPYCVGYAWAEGAIVDLWKKGAPVPQSDPQAPERRILIPEYFSQWWQDVQQRMGYEATALDMYPRPSKQFKTHNM